MNANRPNFFVVGAPKAGTTALYYYLQQHPEIFLPERKELHFFTRDLVRQSYYQPQIIRTEKEYLTYFALARGHQAIGDISPSYLRAPEAAARIYHFHAKSKIIILLRNPIERTISHYLMDVSRGFQDCSLLDFIEPTTQTSRYHYEYIQISYYFESVKRYLDQFGAEQILILITEEMNRNSKATCQEIFQFLDLDDHVPIDTETQHYTYGEARFGFIRGLRSQPWLLPLYQKVPTPLRTLLRSITYQKNMVKPPMVEVRPILIDLFHDDIERLAQLLNRDLFQLWGLAPSKLDTAQGKGLNSFHANIHTFADANSD